MRLELWIRITESFNSSQPPIDVTGIFRLDKRLAKCKMAPRLPDQRTGPFTDDTFEKVHRSSNSGSRDLKVIRSSILAMVRPSRLCIVSWLYRRLAD
jgi:hypothetical protein